MSGSVGSAKGDPDVCYRTTESPSEYRDDDSIKSRLLELVPGVIVAVSICVIMLPFILTVGYKAGRREEQADQQANLKNQASCPTADATLYFNRSGEAKESSFTCPVHGQVMQATIRSDSTILVMCDCKGGHSGWQNEY